eukprot:TRINITY_DN21207_c0_g1_i1.p1 TRINITY_DN21207_c0_g1~~TRINITY_DN21207_c0_g1_i1.p1  ORF type:complete len:361 (+),score=73.18 TRINITY_DN21207_c0_g1_i1:68-1150(+)
MPAPRGAEWGLRPPQDYGGLASPFDLAMGEDPRSRQPAMPQVASPFDLAGAGGGRGPASPFDLATGASKATASSVSPFDAASRGAAPTASAGPPPQEEYFDFHTEATRYFVITSSVKENVVKSVRHGLWATMKKNEARLDDAFATAPAVILVFSVQRSNAFQGYALMRSRIGRPRSASYDPFNGFGRLFDVEWLRLHDLPYREVSNLCNSLNGDLPVSKSRDGQELSNRCGRRLCQLIDKHIDEPEAFRPPPAPVQQPVPAALPPVPIVGPPPGAVLPRARSRSLSREAERRRGKRRRAPEPYGTSFEQQLEYFLGLDYAGYLSWWQKHGAVCPGPTFKAGPTALVPLPPPPSAQPPSFA